MTTISVSAIVFESGLGRFFFYCIKIAKWAIKALCPGDPLQCRLFEVNVSAKTSNSCNWKLPLSFHNSEHYRSMEAPEANWYSTNTATHHAVHSKAAVTCNIVDLIHGN